MGRSAVLGLDVGGSAVKSGVVLADGELLAGPYRSELDSAGPAEPILAVLAAALDELLTAATNHDGEPGPAPTVAGIGVSMPGPCDYALGMPLMRGLGKFESIYGLDLATEVVARVPALAGLSWRWLNDAQAFALGELRFGAAKAASRAMFLTLGTGCGSAFAVDGRLATDREGVPASGFVYPLLHGGRTIDELLSARGVMRLWRKVAGEGGAQEAASAAEVGLLAEAGDQAALAAFSMFGELLAASLGPVFAAFRPEVVVFGGQVSRSLRFFAPAAREAGAPRLVPADTPDEAALRGAAVHLLEGAG